MAFCIPSFFDFYSIWRGTAAKWAHPFLFQKEAAVCTAASFQHCFNFFKTFKFQKCVLIPENDLPP
jgi:hypothetical protein